MREVERLARDDPKVRDIIALRWGPTLVAEQRWNDLELMIVKTGTSGYSYKEWKGTFYPEKLPAKKMLEFYAENFDTVEINATFYRMPTESMMEGWRDRTPPEFRFVLKTPRRITHSRKLAGADEDFGYFCNISRGLEEKRGPILLQLPPYLKKDAGLLRGFLASAPADVRIAVEPRHESWFDEEIETIIIDSGNTMLASDVDEAAAPELMDSAEWGYARLRRTEYTDDDLARWRDRIEETGWGEAWIFFKHEDEGKGPDFARRFLALSE